MQVHIGSIIKARAKSLRIGPTELGDMMQTSKQNVYGIFKRESIDTGLLYRISLVLEFDFFQYFSHTLGSKDRVANGTPPIDIDTDTNSRPILDLEKENSYLKRLNALLEEKLGRA
jgi:hypothetical protein